MSIFRRSALLAALVLASGCSIHPLPEDVTGVPTHIIVRQIRCETRQAVIRLALGWLTEDKNLEDRLVDQRSREVGFKFQNKVLPIQEFHPKLFNGRVRALVQLFYDTGVAYNFDLEMTETNNLNTEINLLKPIINPKSTFGIKANADRERKNERTFTVTDTFSGLLRLPDDYCNGQSVDEPYNVPPNYIYPITGEIGAKRMVADFINMTLFSNLGGPTDKPAGPPTLVDALQFRTSIGGSLAPKIAFSPVGTGWGVADAALTGEASRTDLHKVTMGLAIDKGGARILPSVRAPYFTPLLTARTTTSTEAAAAEAVNQSLTLRLFRPTIVVAQ